MAEDQDKVRAGNRRRQQRRRERMSPDERRAEWNRQQRAHRAKQPKALFPTGTRSISARRCTTLEAADLLTGRAYVGGRDQEHEIGLVDETTAPVGVA